MPNQITVRIQADGKSILETTIDSHAFANALDIPFPPSQATQFSIEFHFVNSTQYTSWATFRQVKMAEAELLNGTEEPQWNGELQNLAQQSGDTGNAGAPDWGKTGSHPIQSSQILDLNGSRQGWPSELECAGRNLAHCPLRVHHHGPDLQRAPGQQGWHRPGSGQDERGRPPIFIFNPTSYP